MATPQPKYIAPVRSVAGMTFAGGNAPPTRTIPATNKSSRRAKKHADGGTAVAGIKALTCYLLRPARIHYLDHRCLKPLAIPFYFCVPLRHSAVPYEIPGLARRPGRRASHDASAGRLRLNHPRAPAVRIIPHTHGQMNGIRWLAPFFHFFRRRLGRNVSWAPAVYRDIDIFVEPCTENGIKIVTALKRVRFGQGAIHADDFSRESVVVPLGYPPNRIDLMTSIDGVTEATPGSPVWPRNSRACRRIF